MLSILYFATMTKAEGIKVCFDLEAGNRDLISFSDDEINEDTTCNICTRVSQNGNWITSKKCRTGVSNRNSNDYRDCIDTEEEYDKHAVDYYVQTDCGNGMWLDRLEVKGCWQGRDCQHKWWGRNNDKGWCLSTDAGDHDKFRAKTNGKCYQTLKFRPDGGVSGWAAGSGQPTLRRLPMIERRLAGMPGNVLDLTLDGQEPSEDLASVAMSEDLASVAMSEDLAGFTEGEELAVPMERL